MPRVARSTPSAHARSASGRLLRLLVAAVCGIGLAGVAAPAEAAPAYRLHRVRFDDGSSALARWNPCQRAITYKINVRGVRPRERTAALRDARRAVRKVGDATRMRFRYKGRTAEVPRPTKLHRLPAEIVIAYVRPRQLRGLRGPTAGLGGSSVRGWTTESGRTRAAAVRGFVAIDHPETRRWRRGFGRGVNRGNLLLHELGHVVGLDHVNNRRQLMNPYIHHRSPNGFARGDRRGLRKMGRSAGCIRVPR